MLRKVIHAADAKCIFSQGFLSLSVTTWNFWFMKECRCLSSMRRAPATAPLRIPVPGAAPHGCTHININDTAPPLM